jgi:hypothetical protein
MVLMSLPGKVGWSGALDNNDEALMVEQPGNQKHIHTP